MGDDDQYSPPLGGSSADLELLRETGLNTIRMAEKLGKKVEFLTPSGWRPRQVGMYAPPISGNRYRISPEAAQTQAEREVLFMVAKLTGRPLQMRSLDRWEQSSDYETAKSADDLALGVRYRVKPEVPDGSAL